MAGATILGTNTDQKTRSIKIRTMQDDTFLLSIGPLLHTIANILVLVACIILVTKHRTIPNIIMLVAQIFIIFFSIGSIVWFALSAEHGTESLIRATKINSIIGPLPYIVFAIGMIWHAIQTKMNSRKTNEV